MGVQSELACTRTIALALQESVHEAGEPGGLRVVAQGSKPHLPVQPGLVRGHQREGRARVPRLVHEVNLLK